MNRRITEFLKIPESIRIPYFGGKWYCFLNWLDNKSIIREKLPENALNTEKRDETVTVSLTSFPARIEYVHLAIKSLMLQSYKPDRIVLWLAEEQFPEKVLPAQLLELTKHGLEICWVDDNLYGHKKHYNALIEQKENELVITYDDDIIYSPDSIEKLIKTHKKYPNCVVCNRAQAMSYDKAGNMNNPGRWETISNIGLEVPTYKILPSNGGGCLYPFGAVRKELVDADNIKKTALKADDLWVMFVCAESGTKIIKTCKYHKIFSVVLETQVVQLATDNVACNMYFERFDNLKNAFPTAYNRIVSN
ncbi:MAG: glycosyltransferase family 2 protein [Clostridia bacterium]|nr:glycosyltransferase family 2 protein [Clostridia bacterium]